jgi:hypothetical protein
MARGGARESKTSERRLEAAEKQRKALELRKAGTPFEVIARELGYRGPSSAYNAVMSALRKTLQEPADEVRNLELTRLDNLLLKLWHRALAGRYTAIDRVLKILERRAKLLGLDAPVKVEGDLRGVVAVHSSVKEMTDAELERIASQTGSGASGIGAKGTGQAPSA